MQKVFVALATASVLLLALATVQRTSALSVMSVDLGSEWMETAIVSPGVPMEIVLNKESKRKSPTAIAFRNQERVFGEDALNTALRFPDASFQYFLDLLGKPVDHPIVQLYQKRFPYYQIEADPIRNTVVFRTKSNETYSVEELVGQLLEKARLQAEDANAHNSKSAITDSVLIVPGYFGQAERKAYLNAANLAGLKVLQLINDYTAVALNYALYRLKDINETAQYYAFYDMGASKSSAAVISFQLQKDKVLRETVPVIQVLGVGFDRTLGGLEMQLRLRDYLGEAFNKMGKTKTDVFTNARAVAKLFKEAGRVKNVLSANTQHYAQIEGLLEEIDFKFEVTREKFEEITADLYDRVTGPLDRALAASGLSLDVLNQVILFGGATRSPKVQDILRAHVKQDLGKNVNSDEAAVMGAVYRGAELATGFRVKKIVLKDAVVYPIQVTFDREGESGQIRQVKRSLFAPMNPYPQKKVITFNKHTEDFAFNVNYGDLDHLGEREIPNIPAMNLSQVLVTGVVDALKTHTGENGESKGIKAHFVLDDSGLLELSAIDLVVEKIGSEAEEESTLTKLGNTFSKLFSGNDDVAAEKKEDEKSQETEADAKDDSDEKEKDAEKSKEKTKSKKSTEKQTNKTEVPKANETDGTPTATNATEAKPKITIVKEPIAHEVNVLYPDVLIGDDLKASRTKLQALLEIETAIARRQGAVNALESFVVETNQKLGDEEYTSCGTEKEIEKILSACAETSDWLYEDGEGADAETYEKKLNGLRKLTQDLFARHWEHSHRADHLVLFDKMIDSGWQFLAAGQNFTKHSDADDAAFTPAELQTLEKQINAAIEWRDKEVAAQEKLKKSEPIQLTVELLNERMAELNRDINYLVKKLKYWRPKLKPAATKPTNATTNETTTTDKTIPTESDTLKLNETDSESPSSLGEQEQLDFPELLDETDAANNIKPNKTEKQSETDAKHTEL